MHEDDDGVMEEFPGVAKATEAALQPSKPLVPPLPERPDDLLDMDSVLGYTQKVRVGVIKTINKALEQEVSSEMITALLKTTADMDKAVVNRKRVGIEEEAAKTSEQQQRDTAGLLRAIATGMFRVQPNEVDPNRQAPTLSDSLPPPDLVPGETEIGTPQLSYDAFAKEQQSGT